MLDRLDPIDKRLLDEFPRDFPIVPRPFRHIAETLGCEESTVIARLSAQIAAGRIARIGATVRPNTVGASTLAALSVPLERIEEVAAQVGAHPGVNHSYLREHDWNLWFVATAPDVRALDACLDAIRAETGLTLLDLRLIRPFNIDLGFSLSGAPTPHLSRGVVDMSVLEPGDRPILAALSRGLELTPRPYAALARGLNRPETEILDRIALLARAAIITRLGVIVRHRSIGWRANAMVAWNVAPERMEVAGPALAALPGVTLCYQRRTEPGLWPFGLFSMIHARTRPEALTVIEAARQLPELAGVAHEILFSERCFKQTGAHIAPDPNTQSTKVA